MSVLKLQIEFYTPFRWLALAAIIMISAPSRTEAGLIQYSWSGRIELRTGEASDPLGLGGDGLFNTVDGTPFELSVRIADDAIGQPASPEGRRFPVVAADLLLNGMIAAIQPADFLTFIQRDDQNRNDLIFGSPGDASDVTFNGETSTFIFGIRMAGGTFQQGDDPPLFSSTVTSAATQGIDPIYVIYTTAGSPVTVSAISSQAVPEPSSFTIFGLLGLSAALGSRLRISPQAIFRPRSSTAVSLPRCPSRPA